MILCSSKRLACSNVEPFNRLCCFFCQGDMKEDLHEVSMFNRNKKLHSVLEKVKWPHLTIQYNSAIDARAGDFKYHTSCWVNMLIVVDESLNVNKHNYNFHEDKMRVCIGFEILQRVEYSLNNGDVLSIRSIVEESLRQPALLVSVLKWFLTGVEKQIDGERGKHLDSLVRSLADTLLYNMKTKRQVDYLPQTDVSFKHTNENL